MQTVIQCIYKDPSIRIFYEGLGGFYPSFTSVERLALRVVELVITADQEKSR